MTLSTQSASNTPVSAPSSPPELKPAQLDPHQQSKAADGAESPSKTTLRTPRTPKSSQQPANANANGGDDSATWGSNFWVTLVDPQVRDPEHAFAVVCLFCLTFTSTRHTHLSMHVLRRAKSAGTLPLEISCTSMV